MDPISALSLACNIIDLVGKAIKGGKTVLEVYESGNGRSVVSETINREAEGLRDLIAELQSCQSQPSYRTADEKMRDISTHLMSRCVELQKVLEDCRSSQKRGLLSAFEASFRLFMKNGKIEQIQQDIVSLRDELFRWITMSTRASVSDSMKSLQDISQTNRNIQATLNAVEAQLLLALGSTDSPTENGATTCLEEIKEIVTDRLILQSLYTPNLRTRFEEVQTQEGGTFEWIFTKPEIVFQSEPHLATTFPAWLRSGDGIFHICGKPGSGKSTLMKYICRNPKTKELLREWAGNDELLIAKFFFWRIGTDEQKNMKGLIRALLHQVLDKVPKLSRDIFPKEIRDRFAYGLQKHHCAELDSDEMMAAFSLFTIVSTSSSLDQDLPGIRICIFIDGLDEFDISKIDQSYRNLVNKLLQWTKNSGGQIKMCVSSRIEEPFTDMLDEKKRFTLHNLTNGDIRLFVEQSLEGHPKFRMHRQKCPRECLFLIETIIQSAEGVFLWVALVLKDLEAGLDDDIPITRLYEDFLQKPADLDTLLGQIMRGISQASRRGVEVLLSAVLRATGMAYSTGDRFRDYNYSRYFLSSLGGFLVLRAADTGVPMKHDVDMNDFDFEKEAWLKDGMTDNEVMREINRILRTRCKGLIDIGRDQIKFMHRSVPEFLLSYFGHATVPVSDYSNTAVASWSLLIDVKWVLAKHSHSLSLFSFLHSGLVSMSSNKFWNQDVRSWLIFNFGNFIWMLRVKIEGEWEEVFRILLSIEQILSLSGHSSMSIIVASAFAGFHEFIGWLFRETDVLTNENIRFRLISKAITTRHLSPRIMEILFAHGMDGRFVLPIREFERLRRDWIRQPAWHHALLCMEPGSVMYWVRFCVDSEDRDIRATIIELWLRHGANPRVRFRLSEDGCECVGVSGGPGNSDYLRGGDDDHYSAYEVSSGLQRIGKRELSLRDIVLDWKPHNESVLLELLQDDVEGESPTTQEPMPIQSHSPEMIDDHMKDASTPQDSTTNLEHEQSCGVTGSEQPPYAWVMHISAGLYPCLALIGALGFVIAYFVWY
ncbi:hypothetical protein F5Y07DRAFT_406304 [Xylaria sp. FL0933]|nr:hypothetical protein F5Y07DRAFT_406304 [Xylaria sp. FL0933]